MSDREIKMLFGFPEYGLPKVNGVDADYPAAETYDKFTPDEIKALCELDVSSNTMFRKMPAWGDQLPNLRLFHRLKAYWASRGAEDFGSAACEHLMLQSKASRDRQMTSFELCEHVALTSLYELERRFLPPVLPNVKIIIERCPQMAMIYALRGDVPEPYWWAVLSITEHATPNLSRECSDGYSGFTEDELSYRVGRIHDDGIKPALCERMNEVNHGVCDQCKFKGDIRSPIALGYEHEPKSRKVIAQ